MADKRLLNIQGWWSSMGGYDRSYCFPDLAELVKLGIRNIRNKSGKIFRLYIFHIFLIIVWRTSDCLIVSLDTLPPSSAPSFGQLGTEFIRFVLLLFFLQTAPPPPHHPSLVPLTVVIGSAGIIQRLDIIYCLPCTIPPPSHPFLNCTRCPADELIILEILFLLLIPPFYEQLLFYGAIDLTPAWSHSC